MKTLAKLVIVLAVLGFCLPSYGEILVYKLTDKATCFEQEDGLWDVWKETNRGYLVLDVNYNDYTITQAEAICYWKDKGGKKFDQTAIDLELVRVEYDTKVEWVIMEKDIEVEGETINGNFLMVAGQARDKNIGLEGNREVATKLSGYNLEDETEDAGRYTEMSKISFTLYSSWTKYANTEDDIETEKVEGLDGDCDAAVEFIKEYLEGKGYEEEV